MPARARRKPDELYEAMSDAIAYLRAHAADRPGVAEVAAAVGMSPSRFSRAFAAWVGTTPKRFLAHLTKERAKELLAASRDVLGTSRASGLSGPGRLHDLMVTHEALSPGEFKDGRIGIAYGVHVTPFGWCAIGLTGRGICHLAFLESGGAAGAARHMRERWPRATLARDDARTAPYAQRIFALGASRAPLHLVVRGTNFQVKVWEALLAIPPGAAADYAGVARAIGAPRAVRAVGSACGRNAIAFLIPCHRVLAGDGGLGGYRWGLERKEAMLAWEAARGSGPAR